MALLSGTSPALRRSLAEVVGPEHVLTGEVAAGFGRDWTGRFTGVPGVVVRPADHDEVAAVVERCAAAGAPIVPQGGNTGLVGGGVPGGGEVVVSLTRLDGLEPVDELAGQVTAGAGVTLASLQAAAHDAGWEYPVDLAARDAATVGGMVATNAGGVHVVRHGSTRHQLIGVRAVLADGSSVGSLAGLVKDNTGYHLPSLLAGSEGTLALVTAARLALVAPDRHRTTALVSFASAREAIEATGPWRRDLPGLAAVELILDEGVSLVVDELGLPEPPVRRSAAYLLVEAGGPDDVTAALAAVVGEAAGVVDAAVADDGPGSRRLWAYRERHTEAIARLGVAHKLDVALPARALASFVESVPGAVAATRPEARTWLFGHVADGNVHVNVTGVVPDDEVVDGAVLALVAELGGSISAEHGIGRAKRPWLHLTRSTADIAAMRAVKRALDPDGVLNPGVLLPDR